LQDADTGGPGENHHNRDRRTADHHPQGARRRTELPHRHRHREAFAIDRRLKCIRTPRPLTHELLAAVIEHLGGQLEKIVINDLKEHTFFSQLLIRQDGKLIEIDSRPSDAIALGVANDIPIYVEEHVLTDVSQ